MKTRLFLAAFAATLALVVAQRLNAEALAVLAGVAAGAAAAWPANLWMLWSHSRDGRMALPLGSGATPIQSLPAALPAPAPVPPSSPTLPSGARRFVIFGQDGEAVL
ncbi:MAG: hypothetical protein HYZ35_08175 [Chloroflexi bacterium]|nr:hypothetical protein [Chloroflexota bacterium]MBI4315192.1 hypothetical protein [Chloroflexota bacterium]